MPRSQEIDTEVGSLHVDEFGNRALPAVMLWPSLYCTGGVWSDQIAVLAPHHRVLVVDPPGHGRSGVPPRRFTLEATARATLTVLDAFSINDVTIVGGAWGGMVGVVLAALSPDRVRGLVLINSPLDRWRGRQRVEITLLAALLRVGGARLVASLLTNNMLSDRVRRDDPQRVRGFSAELRALDRRGLHRSARSAMLDRPSLLPLLPRLKVPVLVIAGSEDSLWPVAKARAEVAMIPGARFEVVPGTAHLSAFEAPQLVNHLLIEFLKTVTDGQLSS
jgi:3-oxoadipate enol-lactonase